MTHLYLLGDYPHCACKLGLVQIDLTPFINEHSPKQQSLGLRKRKNISYREEFYQEEDIYVSQSNPYLRLQKRHGEPFQGTSKFKRLERIRRYREKKAKKSAEII